MATEDNLWFWVLGWLLSITTTTGNGFVILLISCCRRLHTSANWFILSLAVADFCVGCTLVPFIFTCEALSAAHDSCRIMKHFRWFFVYASVTNLCGMAADRYIAIVKPLRYPTFMRRSCLALLLTLAWGIPALFRLVGFSVLFSVDKRITIIYVLPVVLILFEFIPCAVLVVVTSRMVFIARRISRSTRRLATQVRYNHAPAENPGGAACALRSGSRTESSGVRVIGSVVLFFVVCYAASLFASFCDIFRDQCSTPDWVSLVRRLCLVANSAANPLAYAFLKKDIRAEFRRIRRRFCAHKVAGGKVWPGPQNEPVTALSTLGHTQRDADTDHTQGPS